MSYLGNYKAESLLAQLYLFSLYNDLERNTDLKVTEIDSGI